MKTNKKGFTLIELLITIGVLAVLATVVVLVLNPAELFRQARDTRRLSDLGTVRDAIVFTLGTESTGQNIITTARSSAAGAVACDTADLFTTACVPVTTGVTDVDGTGWVGVDLRTASGGTPPLGALPVDPLNTAANFYAYKGTSANLFKLGTFLESEKYATTENLDANDGGSSATMYEVGTTMAEI